MVIVINLESIGTFVQTHPFYSLAIFQVFALFYWKFVDKINVFDFNPRTPEDNKIILGLLWIISFISIPVSIVVCIIFAVTYLAGSIISNTRKNDRRTNKTSR